MVHSEITHGWVAHQECLTLGFRVWNGTTDWRLATAKEKAKFKTEIDIRRKKAERELEVIAELQKIIQ